MLGTRPLGSSGLDVSVMSLGSWRTFERLPGDTRIGRASCRERVCLLV